ncbi:MAG: hypothetical protein ACTHJM_10305 [Marmoricola sp.]
MGAILIPVLIVVIIVVALGMAAKGFVRRERDRTDRVRSEKTTLRYEVPPGQDPTEVILELARAGYEVVPDATVGQSSEILIGRRGRRVTRREDVRSLLEKMSRVNAEGGAPGTPPRVRFMDED